MQEGDGEGTAPHGWPGRASLKRAQTPAGTRQTAVQTSWGECPARVAASAEPPGWMPAGILAGTSGSVSSAGAPGVAGAGSWRASWGQNYVFSVPVGCAVQVGVPKVTTL